MGRTKKSKKSGTKKINKIDIFTKENSPKKKSNKEDRAMRKVEILIHKELEATKNSRLYRNTSNFDKVQTFENYDFDNDSEKIFFESMLSNQEMMSPHRKQDSFTKLLKIAEILLEKPKVLFIDEDALKIKEMANLDYFSLLKQNLPRTYFFVVLNGKENLKNFNWVIFMKDGRISWKGDPKNLNN